MRNEYLIAGAAVIGIAVGASGGYIFASKKLEAKFNEDLEHEIAEAKEFYSRLNKTGDFATPESAAEALGVSGNDDLVNAAEALLTYKGVTPENIHDKMDAIVDFDLLEEAAEEIVESNVFQDSGENIDTSNRNPEEGYLITQAEWLENASEHDQVSLTWFEGDKVLCDDDSTKPIPDRCVGPENLTRFGVGLEEHIILVRNERLKMDYEIARSTGKYAHEVMGFEHSDHDFGYTRRKRHLSDD